MKQLGTPWLLIFVPLLFAALSVPLALNAVEPNAFYGVRTAATRASEAAWYHANHASGIGGIVGGLIGFGVNLIVARSAMPAALKHIAYLAVLVAATAALAVPGLVA